jgi:hypothetical protein
MNEFSERSASNEMEWMSTRKPKLAFRHRIVRRQSWGGEKRLNHASVPADADSAALRLLSGCGRVLRSGRRVAERIRDLGKVRLGHARRRDSGGTGATED